MLKSKKSNQYLLRFNDLFKEPLFLLRLKDGVVSLEICVLTSKDNNYCWKDKSFRRTLDHFILFVRKRSTAMKMFHLL